MKMDDHMHELFKSSHDALVFALNYAGQAYERPMMNRLSDTPRPAGKGLSGLDGAAQSGMLRAELSSAGGLYEAVMIARYAPHALPCDCKRSCCSGKKPNQEWLEAISTITQHATSALAGKVSNRRLREGIIRKYFGEKVSLQDLAEACGVNRDTASDHNSRVVAWLRGSKPGAKKVMVGVEHQAFVAVDERLRAAGVIEQSEMASA